MNFIKKILGYNKSEDPSVSDISDEIFDFLAEAKLIGYTNGEKQEM